MSVSSEVAREPETGNAAQLARRLLAWYARSARDLPWRRTRDPWAIWVSEVMLQQTRVETVREAWARFVARFPEPSSFARASDDELLAAWSGLGYYRRARALREAARVVAEQHGDRVPDDAESFAALPGVGPYTSGAVLSIAFDQARVAVDGNVERVAARMLALQADPKSAPARRRIVAFAESLVVHGRPSLINQALMELGATLCTARKAECKACPWRNDCAAQQQDIVLELPRSKARSKPDEVQSAVVLCERDGLVLARRIPRGEINEGQLGLPGLGIPERRGDDLAAQLLAEHGLRAKLGERLGQVRHTITRYRLTIDVVSMSPPARRNKLRGLVWADPNDESLPWTTVSRKALRAAR